MKGKRGAPRGAKPTPVIERDIPLAWRRAAEREHARDLLGVLREPSGTYYMTRSRRDGALSERVEVWVVAPERVDYTAGDVEWYAPSEFVDIPDAVTYVGTWSTSEAKAIAGTIPQTDSESVRVGREAD